MPGIEPTIAIQIEGQPLKQPTHIAHTITPAFEHLPFRVESFNESAGLMLREIVGKQILPGIQQGQKAIKTRQAAFDHPLAPIPNAPQPIRFRPGGVKNRRQFIAQRERLAHGRTVHQKALQALLVSRIPIIRLCADQPHQVLEVVLLVGGQRRAQPAHFLLAQRVHAIAIVTGHMEAIHHNGRIGQGFLHRGDRAFPHVGTYRLDVLPMGFRNRLQPGRDRRLHAIRQYRQHQHASRCGLRGDNSDIVAATPGQGNLVNPQHGKRLQHVPVNTGGNLAIQDAQQRVITDIFPGDAIADGAVDQLNNQMPLIGFGMQRVGVVPVQLLRRGRLAVTVGTAKAFGANA